MRSADDDTAKKNIELKGNMQFFIKSSYLLLLRYIEVNMDPNVSANR
jgi:hypothetical protein